MPDRDAVLPTRLGYRSVLVVDYSGDTNKAISPRLAIRIDCNGFEGAEDEVTEAFPLRVKVVADRLGSRERTRMGPCRKDIAARRRVVQSICHYTEFLSST